MGILGEPISKLEFRNRVKLKKAFLVGISRHIRYIVEAVARMQPGDVQRRVIEALDTTVPIPVRARSAWEVLAWHHFLKPYQHPDRGYVFNMERLIPIIEKDADSLFLYGMLLVKEPSEELYGKLKSLNAPVAKQYRDYCRNYTIVQHDEDVGKLLFGW
jgi:hypothetical protein